MYVFAKEFHVQQSQNKHNNKHNNNNESKYPVMPLDMRKRGITLIKILASKYNSVFTSYVILYNK